MKILESALLLLALLFAGCSTTHDVAVSSYHVTRDVAVGSYRVATAPVHYALRRHSNEPTMVGTTDAVESDVTEPGHPAPSTAKTQKLSRTSPPVSQTEKTESQPKPSTSSQESSTSTAFPTAKAVP